MNTPLTLEYLAGFFDGEGCVSIIKNNRNGRRSPTYVLVVAVSGTNPVPLRAFLDRFGGGLYSKKVYRKNHTASFMWIVQARPALAFLAEIEPLLVVKRQDASIGIEFQRLKTASASTRRLTSDAIKGRETLRGRLALIHGNAGRQAKEA